jgi:VanZ family protein
MRITIPSIESIEAESDSRPSRFRVVGYWGPVGLYAAFIFYLSSQSFFPDTLPSYIEKLGDKAHHMMAYGLFGLLWYRAFRYCGGAWAAPRAVLLAILASALYGVTDELHQWFVPSREADPWDLMADTAGAAVAVVGMDRWLTRRPAAATVETER